MHGQRPYCLSIAGFDPSGGAGILADIKTFEQNKVYGLGVLSARTCQNDSEFNSVRWMATDDMIAQIEPLLKFDVQAIKIGLIENIEILVDLVRYLKNQWSNAAIVWDPVLNASAGFQFHAKIEIPDVLQKAITLITPNSDEFEELGFSERLPSTAVLKKGGHRSYKKGTDTLLMANKSIDFPGVEYRDAIEKHGTGCILSSAITAQLALGLNVAEACKAAKAYVEGVIMSNNLTLGYHHV